MSLFCGMTPFTNPSASPVGPQGSANTATLSIEGSNPASATIGISCGWASKTHVTFDLPLSEDFELYGEIVTLQMSFSGLPEFDLIRQPSRASYSGSGAVFSADGWGTARGSMHFQNLRPSVNDYPYTDGVPLPSIPAWYSQPLGGNQANQSLKGTLTWNCGTPPANAPDVEPTPQPTPQPTPDNDPFRLPNAYVSVEGRQGKFLTTVDACSSGVMDPKTGRHGDWVDCFTSATWYVPSSELRAPASSKITFSVAGYKLKSAKLEYATSAEVARWRHGVPDTTVTKKPIRTTSTTATFVAPGKGDWLLVFVVEGTNAQGLQLQGSYFVHFVAS